MEIVKVGVDIDEKDYFESSAFNAVYNSSCNDVGCTCDDCVDGG